MAFDRFAHGGDLLDHPHLDEADDTRVRQSAHENQLPEVLVLRDENPFSLIRQRKQRFICGPRIPVPDGNGVVAEIGQGSLQAPR